MTSALYKENFKKIDFSKPIVVERNREAPPKRSHLPAPMIFSDYASYECPITGKTVDGRREHNENLKRHGCRVFEKGEFEDVKKNGKSRINEQIDAAVDRAVDEVAKDFI